MAWDTALAQAIKGTSRAALAGQPQPWYRAEVVQVTPKLIFAIADKEFKFDSSTGLIMTATARAKEWKVGMQAAALLIVPSMVTNLWQLACGPRFLGLMKRLAGLLLGVIVGTLLVGAWLGGDAPRQATGVLGLALVAYALLGLAAIPLHLPARHEPWAGPLVGLATGALTAVTGVFVIPAVPYLGALGLQRDELVQALGLSFSASTLALAVTLGVHGDLLEPQMLGASLLTLVPALGGMLLGQWLRQRISATLFRRCFFVGLLLLGADLAWRGFH